MVISTLCLECIRDFPPTFDVCYQFCLYSLSMREILELYVMKSSTLALIISLFMSYEYVFLVVFLSHITLFLTLIQLFFVFEFLYCSLLLFISGCSVVYNNAFSIYHRLHVHIIFYHFTYFLSPVLHAVIAMHYIPGCL